MATDGGTTTRPDAIGHQLAHLVLAAGGAVALFVETNPPIVSALIALGTAFFATQLLSLVTTRVLAASDEVTIRRYGRTKVFSADRFEAALQDRVAVLGSSMQLLTIRPLGHKPTFREVVLPGRTYWGTVNWAWRSSSWVDLVGSVVDALGRSDER